MCIRDRNVHESPNGFRWRVVPERNDSCVLEEGMIQSDEPGVYLEGRYGIRHENETIVRKGEKNEYGQFMYLETITFVPFDLDGVDAVSYTHLDVYKRQDHITPCFHGGMGRELSPAAELQPQGDQSAGI